MKTTCFRILQWTSLLLALALALPGTATATDEIFVRIDGILGESTEIGHEKWIEARAVGNSVSQVSDAQRAAFSDIAILKNIDRASPLLFVGAAMGTTYDTVTIDFVREGRLLLTYFRMQLFNAVITGVRTNANSTDGSVTEFVTLKYSRISWSYTVQNDDGSPGDKVQGCWDLATNAAC